MRVSKRIAGLVFGSVLLALAGPAAGADGVARRSPVVQLHGSEFRCAEFLSQFGHTVCVRGLARERSVSVFWNGRVISVTTETAFAQGEYGPPVSTVREEILPRGEVRQLAASLESQGIATAIGRCNPFPNLRPSTGSGAQYQIFWYGSAGSRRNVLFVGTEFLPAACAPQVLAVFNAIVGFGAGPTE